MVSAGHVSAVDNAIKARRRPWQTLGEYLVERYDDISSAYPIEVERWKQASYMLDAVLLEEDLSRRRRDILEAQHVVRALEACWTSWGGTTTAGLDFERYRAQHLRLYRTLLGLEALDPSLALLVDRSIEKDWAVDREMAVFGSGAAGRAPSRTSGGGGGGARNRSTSPSADSASAASGARRDSSITSGLARQPSQRSLSGENKREGSKESASAADDAVNDPAAAAAAQQVEYEVPFRRFCISMLELADNWTRARVGDVFSQIFAKFLMKVVWCEPSRDKTPMVGAGAAVPASFAHIQNVEREKQRWQKQFEQQVQQRSGEENNNNGGTGGPSSIALSKDPEGVRDGTRPNSAATGGQQTHGFGDGGGGAGSNSDFDASSSQHSNNPATDEWSRICEGLRRRAFMHRGGPVVRCIPPEAPGMPVQYVALPGTRASAEEENRRK